MTFDPRKPSWRDHTGKAAIVALGLLVALVLYVGAQESELPEAFFFLGIVLAVLVIGLGGAWLKDRNAKSPKVKPPPDNRGIFP